MTLQPTEHTAHPFDLDTAIDHIAHWLPTQGPLKDFIHHNTLHAVQDQPFHEGVAKAARIFGARSYLPLTDYQACYRAGRISDAALDWAIAHSPCPESERATLRERLFIADERMHYPPVSLANHGLRNAWQTRLEVDLNSLVHPVIFRLLSNFLDQGISRWTLAREGEPFWQCIRRLVENSLFPLYPLSEPSVRPLLSESPDAVILSCLAKQVGDEALYEQYLLEMLLGHPGWSGMVRLIECNPNALLAQRQISLKQLLAVELLCDQAILQLKKGGVYPTVAELPNLTSLPQLHRDTEKPHIPLRLRVWHEAMEWSLHSDLLHALTTPPPAPSTAQPPLRAQALFCIDDRECSLRRHLEQANPGVSTFGAAGFFGIDFLYQGLEDVYPAAQCPAVITPKHLVLEASPNPQAEKSKTTPELAKLRSTQGSMWKSWLFTQTAGLGYAAKLAWKVFSPNPNLPGIEKYSEVEAHSKLHLLRENDTPSEDGYLLGFSYPEMADRVGGLLRNIGLVDNFAPIVVVVAHGSSSVNNPHFAAYDCGACSGKPGAPNARAFAWMANQHAVRAILEERGIVIPKETQFVPALHNTSRDEISYFDQQDLSPESLAMLAQFQLAMHQALEKNALERCRWFALAPKSPQPKKAHAHVIARASSIFEPRPEYNHSNNLFCIIGRRSLTRHLFLDRRAFLHSYDPASDNNGDILMRVLSAVIPVCGGINLEYLFSRIDNGVYGAGTKLPHNVIGLLGVANGVEGDLRTGLPQQMIEVHEPARLMMVIEQRREVIDRALTKLKPDLREWLDNDWVRLAAHDPTDGQQFFYSAQGWERVQHSTVSTPVTTSSEPLIHIQNQTLPVHILAGEAA